MIGEGRDGIRNDTEVENKTFAVSFLAPKKRREMRNQEIPNSKIVRNRRKGSLDLNIYQDLHGICPQVTRRQICWSSAKWLRLVFAAWETGEALITYLNNSTESAVYVNILPDGGYPWPPTRFLWPFAAAVGGCLVIMLVRNK